MSDVYIFMDEEADQNYLVFSSLERAIKEGWPPDEEWVEEDGEWQRGECCRIICREIDEI